MLCRRFGLAILLFGLTFPVPAAMVSFLVIEEGVRPGADAGNYSSVWEDGLMSAFFDAGHIVSNSPIFRVGQLSDADLPSEVKVDYADAKSGGADYFIMAVLDFNSEERRVRPISVSVKIFTTDSQEMIFAQQFPAGQGVNLQDEFLKAQGVAQLIAAQIRDR